MDAPHYKWPHVYAILRFDLPLDSPDRVTVVRVLTSKEAADQEVGRLMKVNGDKGCEYVAYTTRFIS